MTYLHLATGSAVIPLDPTTVLLVAPDERFAELTTEAGEQADLLDVLHGAVPVPAEGLLPEIAASVVDWSAGARDDAPRTDGIGAAQGLAGIASVLPDLLAAGGLGRPTVLLAGVLDDAAYLALDEVTTARDPVPGWLPLHRELGALAVGPLMGSGPHLGAGQPPLAWADLRFRRLAASPARAQLLALWEAWHTRGDAVDVRPDARVYDVAAGRLLTWLADPAHAALVGRHQVLVPLDGGPVTTHPVLPVPRGLLGLTAA